MPHATWEGVKDNAARYTDYLGARAVGAKRCPTDHGDPDNPDDTSALPCPSCGATL